MICMPRHIPRMGNIKLQKIIATVSDAIQGWSSSKYQAVGIDIFWWRLVGGEVTVHLIPYAAPDEVIELSISC